MQDQVQNQGPRLRAVEAECVAVEVAWAAAEFSGQSLTALKSSLQGEVGQLTRNKTEPGDEVGRMRRECECEVEDVPFKRLVLQVRLDLTASLLLGVCSSLTTVHERFEQHCGRLAASHWRLESLVVPLVSGFVDRVACLVNEMGLLMVQGLWM